MASENFSLTLKWIVGETVDPIKALQSVEELLYEVSLWVILIPKTFLRVFFSPQWIQRYVASEWGKKVADQEVGTPGNDTPGRFDGYMSPLFFFLIVGIVPLYLLVVAQYSQSGSNDVVMWAVHQSVETSFTVLRIIFLMGPLGFSLGVQLARRVAFGRQSVQRIFYTQCYCFAPLYLLENIFQAIYNIYLPYGTKWIFLLPLLWFLLAEMFTVSQELSIGRLKSVGFTFLCLIGTLVLYITFYFIITVVIGLITGNLRQWLPF